MVHHHGAVLPGAALSRSDAKERRDLEANFAASRRAGLQNRRKPVLWLVPVPATLCAHRQGAAGSLGVRRRSLHSAPRNLANPADRTSHNVRQDTAHTAAEEQRGQMFGKKAKASFLVRNVVVWLLFFHLTCLASAELPACEHPKFPPKIITQEELAPILEQHTN